MNIDSFIKSVKTKRVNIGVVGDSVLDVYYYGKVSRISPEFPVPVLHSETNTAEAYPGGAANVCYQFKHFNSGVKLFSFTDEHALSQVKDIIFFNVDFCVDIESKIPRKIRFYDDEFPMLRHDIETTPLETEHTDERWAVFHNFCSQVNSFDVVILSNYNKGLFGEDIQQKLIDLCNEHCIPTIVDPKSHPELWKGCSIFKLNSQEAYQMTRHREHRTQCAMLMDIVKCDSVIITQQGNGVVGFVKNEYFEYRPKNKVRDVNSVIGAGDLFSAMLALAIAHGVDIETAAVYAFEAGSQYVRTRHNRPISLYELHKRIDPIKAKIMDLNDVVNLREGIYKDEKWVITNGVYDLIHVGHLSTLQAARSYGDKLVVALNSDDSVRRLKGPTRPIIPLEERAHLIASLECVDFVVSYDEDLPYNTIKSLHPNILVKGGDYKIEDISGADVVDKVYITEIIPGNSTTNIISKIKMLSI